LQEFALSLNPDKTRLFEFGRHVAAGAPQRGLGKPESCNLLGFNFVCGKSRRGRFLVERKTRRDRMRAKLKEIKEELRRRRHKPMPAQGKWLRQVVAGFFAYHAVPTNGRSLGAFRYHVTNLWRRTLRRRSQKDRTTWARVTKLADDWLPRPRIRHPWPSQRFAVSTRGRSRMREGRTSGSVRGALSNERPYHDYKTHHLWWMLPRESGQHLRGVHPLKWQHWLGVGCGGKVSGIG